MEDSESLPDLGAVVISSTLNIGGFSSVDEVYENLDYFKNLIKNSFKIITGGEPESQPQIAQNTENPSAFMFAQTGAIDSADQSNSVSLVESIDSIRILNVTISPFGTLSIEYEIEIASKKLRLLYEVMYDQVVDSEVTQGNLNEDTLHEVLMPALVDKVNDDMFESLKSGEIKLDFLKEDSPFKNKFTVPPTTQIVCVRHVPRAACWATAGGWIGHRDSRGGYSPGRYADLRSSARVMPRMSM